MIEQHDTEHCHATHLRLTPADETALRRKIVQGTAPLAAEQAYGEVLRLREAINQYWRRLAVAYPEQELDLYNEAFKIAHPDRFPA